jgi:hypothetical protein
MCSMAVSDIGMVIIGWLMFAVAAMHQRWTLGAFMCRFLTYVQPITGDTSVWTIAVVSIDRFVNAFAERSYPRRKSIKKIPQINEH